LGPSILDTGLYDYLGQTTPYERQQYINGPKLALTYTMISMYQFEHYHSLNNKAHYTKHLG